MSFNCIPVVLVFVLGQPSDPLPRNPLAPSLPQLTAKEEAKFEGIVERFIQYDIGKLPGAAGKKALEDFKGLPPEAIFVLIDGFNRAANMEASCPVVLIGKKIVTILNASDDLSLLTFAKENLGAGVTVQRHLGMLKDVQFSILLRKGAVQRRLAATGTSGTGGVKLSALPLAALVKAADSKKGPAVAPYLTEIEKRQGAKVLETLALAASSPDKDVQLVGTGLLAKHLTRQSGTQLKELLKHERPEVKSAAAREIGARELAYGSELIELLGESDPAIHQAARGALRRLSRGVDHGPDADASFGDRETAQRRCAHGGCKRRVSHDEEIVQRMRIAICRAAWHPICSFLRVLVLAMCLNGRCGLWSTKPEGLS